MNYNNVARILTRNVGASMRRYSVKPAIGFQRQCLFSTQTAQRMDPSVATEKRYESESAISNLEQPTEYAMYVQDARDDLNSPNWGSEQIKNDSAEWQA
ncbi:stress responsive orphan 1 [Schizosaccharomyces osmophilus]|uniref:Stress responsive orphan 1 n=1 Tax=Schizosaccharomyces osmophilus TaxID=2545709 RepID=A0AAF0ATL0_9SCHI|nr:stress responsive orphan 1 [Schizosaccharomyces osmophilus]WBW70742.1 stress responsive orphan 1 [Schizosaccharomyces osmophilus]